MKKTGLAMELFGKKQGELSPEELKLYYREAKRRYHTSPEAVEKKKQRGKVWRETHREEAREYFREYRKSGKALDYTEVYKRAFEFLVSDCANKDEDEIRKYYIEKAKESMREEKRLLAKKELEEQNA